MGQTPTADEPEELVDDEHLPMYEFDADARGAGEIVPQVEREPQLDALASLSGEGAVEPDGWVRDYNDVSVPVVDGVPLLVLGRPHRTNGEGAEKSTWHEVDGYEVRVDHAGAHPGNTSKITVEEVESE